MSKTKILGSALAGVPELAVEAYLHDSVSIYPEALDEDMTRAPADLAYWNERYAQAYKREAVLRMELEREEAVLTISTRETMVNAWQSEVGAAAKGAKTSREPSGDTIRAAVLTNAALGKKKLELIDAECERVRLRGLISAVERKGDMLQSIAAKERLMIGNDPLRRASEAVRKAQGG